MEFYGPNGQLYLSQPGFAAFHPQLNPQWGHQFQTVQVNPQLGHTQYQQPQARQSIQHSLTSHTSVQFFVGDNSNVNVAFHQGQQNSSGTHAIRRGPPNPSGSSLASHGRPWESGGRPSR